MAYCIDTSSILEAWRRSYPPDVFGTVWSAIDELIENHDLYSSVEVMRELEPRDDEVYEWARARNGMFIPLDDEIQDCTSEILTTHPRLVGERANRNHADPFVIATARTKGLIVVTEEDPGSATRPRIPLVCDSYGIQHMKILEVFQAEGWYF